MNLDWFLYQFDIKHTFLHGDLEEEVYMAPPPGCNMQAMVTGKDPEERKALQILLIGITCKPASTSMDENLKLDVHQNQVAADKGR
ncbi:UNVERIFIED_CONTAM: hypothetical protein Sradi_3835600 [Sesamum radiatum]|uniref:Reverse transcriptase Ty1/copia-type domain-containing protein n=1 Tax=Sesamum radiatum TaxID=300843 RepID=A0AAW2Q131_SESRA